MRVPLERCALKKQGSLVIPCARATRGRGLPSLDARTTGINQTALAGKLKKKRPVQNFRCGPLIHKTALGEEKCAFRWKLR